MKYSVSVDQAITRGKWLCVFLPGLVFMACMLGGPLLYAASKNMWALIACIVSGFVFSWLIWSVAVTRWKIWAYTNVRNVHELNKRAVEDRIVWPEGNFFNRTEIKTQQQRYALEQLKARFRERDVFNDDAGVPPETYVYISKRQMYFKLLLGIVLIAFGVYLFTAGETSKETFFGVISAAVGIYMLYEAAKGLRNTKPVLVLSDEGIRKQGIPLAAWDDISGERVAAQHKEFVLEYNHCHDWVSVNIDDFSISGKRLSHLLRVYRGRFEAQNNPQA